jgi:hypothetical protein
LQDVCQSRLSNWSIALTVVVITSRHRLHRKHRSSTVACVFIVEGTCLSRCCSGTADAFSPIIWCHINTTIDMLVYWLRHYAASRKVAGSSPDEVDFLNWPNPSGRIMALGSTQPLTEMSTRNKYKWRNLGGNVRPARKADNLAAIY